MLKLTICLEKKITTYLTNISSVDKNELFDKFNYDTDGVLRIVSELQDEELLLCKDGNVYFLNNLR